LKEIDFLGRKFLIPRDTNRYLELEYGKKWTIPCYNNKKCSAGTLIKNYWNKHKIAIKKTIHTL